MDEFKKWINSVCFQKPTPEAYDLAKDAWKAALKSNPEPVADVQPAMTGLCLLDEFIVGVSEDMKTDEYFKTIERYGRMYFSGASDMLKLVRKRIAKIKKQA